MTQRAQRLLGEIDPIVAIAVVVLAFAGAQLFSGALATGVTTDEPRHTERAEAWLENGWYVPGEFLVDGRPDPENDFASPYVYGPAFSAIAHGANVIVGNESLGGISSSADAYAVRHLVVALLAALAIAAAGIGVWRLTGSARFGLWAAAALIAVPKWTGQAFFNLKDVPAATGYTLVTVGLLLALAEPRGTVSGLRRLAIGALVGGGIFLGAGTRLSLWVPILASLVVYAALRVGQRLLGGKESAGVDLAIGAGAGAGTLAIAALYPAVAREPLSLIAESVSGSANYPYEGFTLTAGQLLSAYPPWWYLPAWIGASFPLLLGALALLGAGAALYALYRAWASSEGRRAIWGRPELGAVLVLQQALMLPLAAVIGGAVIYSGVRQHLYVLPALAILAGLGAARYWAWGRSPGAGRVRRTLVTLTLAAALAVPTVEQLLLFPYNYAYVNPVAGIGGVNDNWETDYWFASVPEAISRVPQGVDLQCSSFLVPSWDPNGKLELMPCAGDQFEPYADRRGDAVESYAAKGDSAIWVIARKRAGNQPPPYCESVGDVTRWLRGETVVMAHVLRCDATRVPPTPDE